MLIWIIKYNRYNQNPKKVWKRVRRFKIIFWSWKIIQSRLLRSPSFKIKYLRILNPMRRWDLHSLVFWICLRWSKASLIQNTMRVADLLLIRFKKAKIRLVSLESKEHLVQIKTPCWIFQMFKMQFRWNFRKIKTLKTKRLNESSVIDV